MIDLFLVNNKASQCKKMSLKLPPAILQKTLMKQHLNFKDGKLYLWGNPCFIDPVYIQIYYSRLIQKKCGEKEANKIRYYTAKIQALAGNKITNKRFGYAKTINDKKKLFLFNCGQTELLGLGKFQWIKLDFDKEIFICNTISPFAEAYKKFYGLQNQVVDFWLMGSWAGALEYILGKKMFAIESNCFAKGDKCCQFIIRPIKKWQKTDALYKRFSYILDEVFYEKELENFIASLVQ